MSQRQLPVACWGCFPPDCSLSNRFWGIQWGILVFDSQPHQCIIIDHQKPREGRVKWLVQLFRRVLRCSMTGCCLPRAGEVSPSIREMSKRRLLGHGAYRVWVAEIGSSVGVFFSPVTCPEEQHHNRGSCLFVGPVWDDDHFQKAFWVDPQSLSHVPPGNPLLDLSCDVAGKWGSLGEHVKGTFFSTAFHMFGPLCGW